MLIREWSGILDVFLYILLNLVHPYFHQVTLNMLNAHHESEVDVEGLPEEVKLQFDTSAQQVAN